MRVCACLPIIAINHNKSTETLASPLNRSPWFEPTLEKTTLNIGCLTTQRSETGTLNCLTNKLQWK